MEIRKILQCGYNISQSNYGFGSVFNKYTYVINVRSFMEFRDDYIWIDDELLERERVLIDDDSGDKRPISMDFNYHFILGDREFGFDNDELYDHYAKNEETNKKLSINEFAIKRLLE